MTTNDEALRIANDSGFPLQIAVQRHVEETKRNHGWEVRYAEHSWTHPSGRGSGFIDLVLQNAYRTTFLLVECKRVRQATWLFLPNDGQPRKRRDAKSWVSFYKDGRMVHYGWGDIEVNPPLQEAHFCAIRGQSTADRSTLIERIGGELISATEALAVEERDFRQDLAQDTKIYLNAIVTTAEIKLARFDAAKISLIDGVLPEAEIETVPYVRLRKQLSTRPFQFSPSDFSNDLDIATAKEHTVLVVRADALPQLLGDLEVSNGRLHRLGGG